MHSWDSLSEIQAALAARMIARQAFDAFEQALGPRNPGSLEQPRLQVERARLVNEIRLAEAHLWKLSPKPRGDPTDPTP